MIYSGNLKYKAYIGNDKVKILTDSTHLYDAEIEYLESTGTLYIITLDRYFNSGDIDILLEFKILFSASCPNLGTIISDFTESGYRGFLCRSESNNVKFEFNLGTSDIKSISCPKGTEFEYSYNRSGTLTTAQQHNIPLSFFVAFNNQNALWRHCHGRLYYCKIYDHDVLVRDFIPVRISTTGFLYDKVSGQLFGNNGIGNFILGNDKTNE